MKPVLACWDDIPRLLTYISAFHQASPYSDLAFSPGATRTFLQALIHRPSACVFIHDYGALAGELTSLRFGKALLAQEIFWWAERDGMSLLGAFEDWAAQQGADLISMAALSGPRFERFYQRRGYAPKEQFFVRQI